MGAGAGKEEGKEEPAPPPPPKNQAMDPQKKARIKAKVRTMAAFSNMSPMITNLSASRRESRQGMLDLLRMQKKESKVAWNAIKDSHGMDNVPEGDDEEDELAILKDHKAATLIRIEDDTECHLCGELAAFNGLSCRVCTRRYHQSCVEQGGHMTEVDRHVINNKEEWCCYKCSDLGRLLSTEQTLNLKKEFEKINVSGDGHITWDEYKDYKNKEYERLKGQELPDDKIEKLRTEFIDMDFFKDLLISWDEFHKSGAGKYLKKKEKEDLVKLLTPKEIHKAQQKFDQVLEKQNLGRRRLSRCWDDFIKSQAHGLLVQRPNRATKWPNKPVWS